MIKKVFVIIILQLISVCLFTNDTALKGITFNQSKVYLSKSVDSQIVGLLNANSVVKIHEKDIVEPSNGDYLQWYKISNDEISGWTNNYDLVEFPCKGFTAVTMNPNKWLIFEDFNLSSISHKYKPNQEIKIIDAKVVENDIIYKVYHNNKEGWISSSKVNILDNSIKRLNSLYDQRSFSKSFDSLETMMKTIFPNEKYDLLKNDEYNLYSIKVRNNILNVVKYNNQFRVLDMVIKGDYKLKYNITNGIKIDYVISLFGNKFKKDGNLYKYEYSQSVLANPIYSIVFKVKNDSVIEIKLLYHLFD